MPYRPLITAGFNVFACLNYEKIGLGYAVVPGDRKSDAVDRFAKLHDFTDWRGIAE